MNNKLLANTLYQHKVRKAFLIPLLALPALLSGCFEQAVDIAGMPDKVDYNWHVRPILSDNCFACHGNDEAGIEAGLRLNDRDMALQELPESPGKYAIIPGKPGKSELIKRITATDIDVRMPPEETHKTLSELEIAILERWIDEGAPYKEHWAFIAPQKPEVPNNESTAQSNNEIDSFVHKRLEVVGLNPSEVASKEALVSRAYLTLTGLPPSLNAIDEFVADTKPDAYEHLIDKLLGSSRYAEHMAAYWMDLARWSDTDGFLDDHHDRVMWPWRDWVIEALGNNMPYDQFGTEQLAGDLLPNSTKEQLLATAYLRVGKRTTENGAINQEYLAETMIERTDNALGTAFMGLTLGCARCHDHRYDPISQKAYYSLGAFFNSNDEPGVYPPGFSGIQAGPTLAWVDSEAQQEINQLEANIEQAELAYNSVHKTVSAEQTSAANALLEKSADKKLAKLISTSLKDSLVAHYPFESSVAVAPRDLAPLRPLRIAPTTISTFNINRSKRNSESVQNSLGKVPKGWVAEELAFSPSGIKGTAAALIQSPIIKQGAKGNALFFDEKNRGHLPTETGWYDRTDAFSVDFWFYANDAYKNVPVINHRPEQNSGSTGYSLTIRDGHLWVQLAHSLPANMIALSAVEPFPLQQWTHVTLTYDGSSKAKGTKLYINGKVAETEVDHDTLTRSILPWSNGDTFESFVGVSFGSRFRAKAPVGAGLDELSFYKRNLTAIEVDYLDKQNTENVEGLDNKTTPALLELLVDTDDRVIDAKAALTETREKHNKVVSVLQQVLVMRDAKKTRPTHVLNRGVYSALGEEVSPRGLESVFSWDESLPQNRLGLAQWLFDERNPLTARVFVNRVWQMHFGRGLVETSEDFGSQGSVPSHPDLLDYLATTFIESGWDIKALHKRIVMSATYQQSSVLNDGLLAKDARNKWLARGPSWRMTAEMVRDQTLALSGLLSDKIGGKSVMPYQPEGIWNKGNTFYQYPKPGDIDIEDHHRRTLYTFIKRNAMHPALSIFDFTNRTESKARRSRSNTPLQSLTLMNDPQFMEAYRMLAEVVLKQEEDTDKRLSRLYRLATRSQPTPEQLNLIKDYYQSQQKIMANDTKKVEHLINIGVTPADSNIDAQELAAMTNVAALVMNSPAAYTVQ